MTSAIGYLKKGKKIRVGDKTRRGGKLLPIVVRKKIAYILVEDISTSVKLTQLQSASQRIKDVKAKTDEDRIALIYSGYASIISIKAEDTFANKTYSDQIFYYNGFGIRGYLNSGNSKKTWRMTLESSSTITQELSISYVALTPELSYDLIDFNNYVLRFYAGVPLIPFAQYSFDDLFTTNGNGIGLSGGLEMEFKINKGFGLHLDAGYKFMKLFFEPPESDNDFNPIFNGAGFSVALSYAY